MPFQKLPNGVILQVSKYQSPPDLCSLLRASRDLANLLSDALLDCALRSLPETERYAKGALYSAVNRGDELAAKRLIDGGIFKRLDEKKLLKRILLDHERRWGEKALPTLLACGCDPETRDSEGRTLLALAATHGLLEVVELLMDRDDVDINSTDNGNNTPLHMAVEVGDYEVVQLLMDDERVDVNWPNNSNRTPLHIAVMMGHDEVVRLLL
ncbi:ankyrin repeat-containing domain protein, partial [Tuber borchii]